MGKTNIASAALLSWDAYCDKPLEQSLPSIYQHVETASRKACNWYWISIRTKRRASIGARTATFLLLIAGTLLPILAGMVDAQIDRLHYTQFGVAALAFGGLLQVADRVFGWSSGWLRYVVTVTAMENLTRNFELEWARYVLDKGGKLGEADVKPLFDLAKQLEDNIAKLQSDETDKWVADFNSNMAVLGDQVKAQRESSDKAMEVARVALSNQQSALKASAAAEQSGALEVSFVFKAATMALTLAIDSETGQAFFGTVWSRLNMSPGQHVLRIKTADVSGEVIEKVVQIVAGQVSKLEVHLPL